MNAPHDPSDDRAHRQALREADEIFTEAWPVWAEAHDVPVETDVVWEPPRVSVVGIDPAHFQPVAVLRFGFEHDGRSFHGLARGPTSAPTFRVWLLPPTAAPAARWWQRLFRGRGPRHRASTPPV